MGNTTVVSFEDAMRSRASEGPTVLTREDLFARQRRCVMGECHAALENITVIKKLKTQEIVVFKDLSVSFPKGRKITLLGHPGAGKQTLINLLQRKQMPSSGQVHINSRISWLIPSVRFFDMKASARENLIFYSRIIGIQPKDLMSSLLQFCELPPKALREPLKNMPDWARKRFSLLLLMYCDFDLHVVRNQLRTEAMKLSGEQATMATELVHGRDYVSICDQSRFVPQNCDLLYLVVDGLVYQFDDVAEGIAVFESLPKPKDGPGSMKEDDDDEQDDEEMQEMIL